jgi:hypothetical protein
MLRYIVRRVTRRSQPRSAEKMVLYTSSGAMFQPWAPGLVKEAARGLTTRLLWINNCACAVATGSRSQTWALMAWSCDLNPSYQAAVAI